jgi:hypothetical protein
MILFVAAVVFDPLIVVEAQVELMHRFEIVVAAAIAAETVAAIVLVVAPLQLPMALQRRLTTFLHNSLDWMIINSQCKKNNNNTIQSTKMLRDAENR